MAMAMARGTAVMYDLFCDGFGEPNKDRFSRFKSNLMVTDKNLVKKSNMMKSLWEPSIREKLQPYFSGKSLQHVKDRVVFLRGIQAFIAMKRIKKEKYLLTNIDDLIAQQIMASKRNTRDKVLLLKNKYLATKEKLKKVKKTMLKMKKKLSAQKVAHDGKLQLIAIDAETNISVIRQESDDIENKCLMQSKQFEDELKKQNMKMMAEFKAEIMDMDNRLSTQHVGVFDVDKIVKVIELSVKIQMFHEANENLKILNAKTRAEGIRNYRRLSLVLHPDKTGTLPTMVREKASIGFNQLKNAYDNCTSNASFMRMFIDLEEARSR